MHKKDDRPWSGWFGFILPMRETEECQLELVARAHVVLLRGIPAALDNLDVALAGVLSEDTGSDFLEAFHRVLRKIDALQHSAQ